MSQYFDMGGETLWNPSNEASGLFRRQVAVFEAELELPSGIGPMENDECEIDPAAFEVFVDALLALHRETDHAVVLALREGFTATVLVLAERAGIGADRARLGSAAAGLREKARELGRRMPR
ncbi:hypothetical protein CF54_05070 [Streptomyces sp. Tu 6176]|uniref:DUF6086 family protein n=1 Tax=Streptomyces sp. Tu 6176 TaxID=1470557 RepID=UPI000452AF59|nr:DUF6086 family protein [Streptomyces sp. Tu 6176]EYT83815.1 hypothetical protein CF54_05070 [Streptomyces sp. Tu 6176]